MATERKRIKKKAARRIHTAPLSRLTLSDGKAGRTLTKADGLYSIVGIGVSKVPGGSSTDKHRYDGR